MIIYFAAHSQFTHHLSKRDERTTDTEEAAIAAEPIHGCSTSPIGMNTPRQREAAINTPVPRYQVKPSIWGHLLPEHAIEPFDRVPLSLVKDDFLFKRQLVHAFAYRLQ